MGKSRCDNLCVTCKNLAVAVAVHGSIIHVCQIYNSHGTVIDGTILKCCNYCEGEPTN